ncbi:glycosyltransferase [Actinomycetospora sp.]|jgi:GT2 family glycosyltransferase|uniref:glycosyltransferase n=1 Tax=Actinomycetospora sp. TaxID=1872135 RepID=UPI002F3F6AB3
MTPCAVITPVAGRAAHLRAQRAALATGDTVPDLHVIVAMGPTGDLVDPGPGPAPDPDSGPRTVVVEIEVPDAGLPLAAARNLGAAEARRHGAELLVFLDVDCLPGTQLLTRYGEAARGDPDAVLAGPVTYLPPAPAGGWSAGALAQRRRPHPVRPDPAPGEVVDGDHRLFWSLSFAVTTATWDRIGGFDESYLGYGAEDTDLGQRARAAGVDLRWVGGADAFHQHHPTSHPPLDKVDDVLRNGGRFAATWGWWPMEGWLADLAEHGAVRETDGGWERTAPLRLLTFPSAHHYLDAVRPPTVVPAPVRRAGPWDPDPLYDPDALTRVRADVDVVHVHFGFDHLDAAAMARWTARVRALGLPLVVTVHDLRNPHHVTREHHDAVLAVLVAAADRLITLTEGAAAELRRRFDVGCEVLPHPSTHPGATRDVGAPEPGLVLCSLKSLRANVVEPARVVAAAVDGAARSGGRVRVDLHPGADQDPELAPVRRAAAAGDLDLRVHGRRDDRDLLADLDRAHVALLPYRFGTHSGWLELCRDRGTTVVAPSCGYFGEQWSQVVPYTHDEHHGLDEASLRAAVATALAAPPPAPADPELREQQRREVQIAHARTYAGLVAR